MFVSELLTGEYTAWGATNDLQREEEALAVLYNEGAYPNGPIDELVEELFEDRIAPSDRICLHQTFV
eukprot:CAMPEP_0177512304 /NCGR_PEP_ID=MMETSP0369-20130122/43145_1 /TAXON_ID=447022 ORGANISM="Scrippsiella hangoei-like, Strain SHHI-4" /NCGR_SAMPLE_ID=MMETSP0369 /ASSEMBLY_ACC=CAM_ASM_000364 /LENGTH=66 /DNA_ID=CAMNT_0018990785 /DNA_START=79 /DNA_END=280 /DNA_ORIENTATION=-